jgi:NitT/TauT family transport system ATP-binding protein
VADDLITVEHIRKAFAVRSGETLAIGDVSLGLREREFLTVVGPSGCGKTTLLRAIAGLLPIDAGEIRHRGRRVEGVLPQMQIVFQEYNRSLFPWLSVERNVRFPSVVGHRGDRRRPAAATRPAQDEGAAAVPRPARADLLARRPARRAGGGLTP